MFKSLCQLRLLCQRLFSCQPCKLLTFIVGFVWACQTPPGSARRPWSRTSCLCTGGRKVEAGSNDPAAQDNGFWEMPLPTMLTITYFCHTRLASVFFAFLLDFWLSSWMSTKCTGSLWYIQEALDESTACNSKVSTPKCNSDLSWTAIKKRL
jgi:hypothetical protein